MAKARKYTRDRRGRFASGSGGGPGAAKNPKKSRDPVIAYRKARVRAFQNANKKLKTYEKAAIADGVRDGISSRQIKKNTANIAKQRAKIAARRAKKSRKRR